METDKKKKKESLGWFCHAIRDNLDFMLKELPTLEVPEDIRTPIRFALARACKGKKQCAGRLCA